MNGGNEKKKSCQVELKGMAIAHVEKNEKKKEGVEMKEETKKEKEFPPFTPLIILVNWDEIMRKMK